MTARVLALILVAALAARAGERAILIFRSPEAKRAVEVVKKRIAEAGLKDCTVKLEAKDRFSVSAPVGDRAAAVKLATAIGRVEFRVTVEPTDPEHAKHWERFKKDRKTHPDGLHWFELSDKAKKSYQKKRLPEGQPWVLCRLDKHGITNDSLENVAHRRDIQGLGSGWMVTFNVKKESQAKMKALTSVRKGEDTFLAIILDGRVVQAPALRSTLVDSGQISGSYTEAEARALAAILKAGALKQAPVLVAEPD